jgi:hypothetical protein
MTKEMRGRCLLRLTRVYNSSKCQKRPAKADYPLFITPLEPSCCRNRKGAVVGPDPVFGASEPRRRSSSITSTMEIESRGVLRLLWIVAQHWSISGRSRRVAKQRQTLAHGHLGPLARGPVGSEVGAAWHGGTPVSSEACSGPWPAQVLSSSAAAKGVVVSVGIY